MSNISKKDKQALLSRYKHNFWTENVLQKIELSNDYFYCLYNFTYKDETK